MLRLIVALCAVLSIASIALAQADEPAAPTTAPATRRAEPATQAAAPVPDDVKPLLDQFADAAKQIKAVDIAGRIGFEFQSESDKQQQSGDFTSAFRAPACFRHEAKGDLLIVSGLPKAKGQSMGYAFLSGRNSYAEFDPPKSPGLDDLPDQVVKVLVDQNPMLFLLISGDPRKQLIEGVSNLKRVDDVDVNGTACPAISFVENDQTYRFAFDPSSHLVRQVRVDETTKFKNRGVEDAKSAAVTIDYTKLDTAATPEDAVFTFQPPKDAIAMKLQSGEADDAGGGDGEGGAAMALVGKPAPDVSLKDLQGNAVTLAQFKGQVVVLDFWATWCGPCVAGIPHLDKLHREKGEQGVKVLGVNQQETQAVVQKFVESRKLSMTILLDTKGDVGKKYKVEGIPETVVVGKDGKVKKVIIGFGGDDKELRDAVDKALGG